jgi:hypothetical protein
MTEALPSSPANGATVTVADFVGNWAYPGGTAGWGSNPQTITGTNIVIRAGTLASSITLGNNFEIATFTWNATYGDWFETDSIAQASSAYLALHASGSRGVVVHVSGVGDEICGALVHGGRDDGGRARGDYSGVRRRLQSAALFCVCDWPGGLF